VLEVTAEKGLDAAVLQILRACNEKHGKVKRDLIHGECELNVFLSFGAQAVFVTFKLFTSVFFFLFFFRAFGCWYHLFHADHRDSPTPPIPFAQADTLRHSILSFTPRIHLTRQHNTPTVIKALWHLHSTEAEDEAPDVEEGVAEVAEGVTHATVSLQEAATRPAQPTCLLH